MLYFTCLITIRAKKDPVGHSCNMASNLAASTLELIHNMIRSNEMTVAQIAEAAGCNACTVVKMPRSIIS